MSQKTESTEPIELQPPQPVAKQPPPATDNYVDFKRILEGEIEPNTVCLLPLSRSAVPTALIARQIKGDVVDVEKVRFGDVHANAVLVLSRKTYRSLYRDYSLPSLKHPYMIKLLRLAKNGLGRTFIITDKMYELITEDKECKDIFEGRGLKVKHVFLDETARKDLENVIGQQYATRLAKVGALLPWLAEELGGGNWRESVRKRLDEMLDRADSDEFYQKICNALGEGEKFPNKPLERELGVVDESRKTKSRKIVKQAGIKI